MSILASNDSEAKFLSTVSRIELLNPSTASETKTFFLKTAKSGHLYNHPIYTAYTKTSLGSIPTKLEKTLIQSSSPKTYSIFSPKIENEQTSFFNPSSFKKDSVSLSKKGYGNGFVSKSERFDNGFNDRYRPGPCEYSKGKLSIQYDVSKSLFTQGLYNNKTNHSILPKKITPGPCDYNPKFYNEIDVDKNSFFFTSDNIRFKNSFGKQNYFPDPGKYFNVDKGLIKDKNKESFFFKENIKKKDNITKRLKIDVGDFCKSNFKLVDKKGEISTNWKNHNGKISGKDYIYVFDKKNNDEENKIFRKFKPDKYNNRFKENEKSDDDTNKYINQNDVIYAPINPNNIPKENLFKLNSPRWKVPLQFNTESQYSPPGPAYYHPKLPNNKVSFNLNEKDFIYTNSIPFASVKHNK